jgi:hypothetical protein
MSGAETIGETTLIEIRVLTESFPDLNGSVGLALLCGKSQRGSRKQEQQRFFHTTSMIVILYHGSS